METPSWIDHLKPRCHQVQVEVIRAKSSACNKEPTRGMADRMKFAVTPAQIGIAREKLAEAGFNLTWDTGVLQKDGYRIGYAVKEGRLIVDLLAKPRFMPMMVVKAKIRSMLAGEGITELW